MLPYVNAVLIQIGIYLLMTFGLNIQFGYTGVVNFGVVASYGIGAYTSAILAIHGVALPVSFAVAAAVAAIVAWFAGLLSLRLRDDYLAIVLLGLAETLHLVMQDEVWLTGGLNGLGGIPRLFASVARDDTREAIALGTVLLLDLAAFGLVLRLIHSPFGRLLQAIRDQDDAVRSLGKDPLRKRSWVLAVGSAFCGVAGAFQAHYIGYISPDDFTSDVTFVVWVAMLLGGAGTTLGPVLGSAVLIMFMEGSRFLSDLLTWIPQVKMATLRLAVVGLALVLITLFFPSGLTRRRTGT